MSREFGICGEIVVSSSSSGGGLTMPRFQTDFAGGVRMKSTGPTIVTDNGAAFWTAIDVSHTAGGYETVKLAAAANTTEQTILDITDAGVLTHVLAPTLSGAGTITIRVTADGVLQTFVSPTLAAPDRYMIGGFLHNILYETTAADGAGLFSANDYGYDGANPFLAMISPPQVLYIGSIGIEFETSLKVTIQGSVNITATAQLLNCCANYTVGSLRGV